MMAVAIRDLKNRLSEYLRLVRAGEEILVTDHGEVVAELRKPQPGAASAHPFAELIAQGSATAGGANDPALYPRLKRFARKVTSRELLDQERADLL